MAAMTSAMEMRAFVPSTWLTSGLSPQLRRPPQQLRPRRRVERGPTARVTERPVRKRARIGHSLDVLKGLFTLLAWPMLVHLLFKFTDILNRWDGVFRHTGLRVLIFIGAAMWLMKASLTNNFEKTTSALNQSLAESFEGFGLQSWLAQKISHFIISVSWCWNLNPLLKGCWMMLNVYSSSMLKHETLPAANVQTWFRTAEEMKALLTRVRNWHEIMILWVHILRFPFCNYWDSSDLTWKARGFVCFLLSSEFRSLQVYHEQPWP